MRLIPIWSRVTRVLFLAAITAGVTQAAPWLGMSVDWETGILFGLSLGAAMNWPAVLPRTNIRMIWVMGLLFEAMWNHGLLTATIMMVVMLALRVLAGWEVWHWSAPPVTLLGLWLVYWVPYFGAGFLVDYGHTVPIHVGASAFIHVYGYWTFLVGGWTLFGRARRSRAPEFLARIQQTWWVPLLLGLVAWAAQLIHTLPVPVTIPFLMLLVWSQYKIGPVMTTLYQDRAVAELLQGAGHQTPLQRATYQRVLRLVHALGRELDLPSDQTRLIGYASLLQDFVESDSRVPLWLSSQPTDDEARIMSESIGRVGSRIERVGVLDQVAGIIRNRFAAYDGQGYPAIAGNKIPIGAQVLAAANAVVALMGLDASRPPMTAVQAARWLRTQSARFHPDVLMALERVCADREHLTVSDGALPLTVRQLRGLVGTGSGKSPIGTVVRRIWRQVWGQAGLAPDLPEEVTAVARMASFFASSSSVAETAQIAVEAAGELLGAKVALALDDGDGTDLNLRFRAKYGFHRVELVGRPLVLVGGALNRAILNQEPVQLSEVSELTTPLASELSRMEGIQSMLCVPLVGRHRTTGVLMVGMVRYHWFTPREVGLIHLMAGQAAIALENVNLMEEAAQRLRHISELKSFTDTLLDNLSTSIVVVDPAGQLTLANESAHSLWGRSFALKLGSPLPEEMAQVCPTHLALAGKNIPPFDVPWGPRVLEVEAAQLRNRQGSLLGAIGMARDVTHMRSMEQHVRRVEKLAAVGELAAGAAHEIRNPLTSIRGFIQLAHSRADELQGEFFQIVLNEIDRIDSIIRDLLLLARPTDLRREVVSLSELVTEACRLREGEFARQRLRLETRFHPDAAPIFGDPKMMRQLMLNLIINAGQAMPDGGALTLAVYPAETEHVALEVTDTGVGIPEENLERLFLPFFTTKEQGTGLGLALCYSIVQAHGGRIDVRSKLGAGSTFVVTLPIRAQQ